MLGGTAARCVCTGTGPAQRGSPIQRHIRQHMSAQHGIIMPIVPFASQADTGCALSLMTLIMTARDGMCQIACS